MALILLFLAGCNEEAKKQESSQAVESQSDRAAASTAATPVPLNLQIGAGYNEQIANINNAIIARSGARWVRAYVNLSRNYWVFGGPAVKPLPPSPQPRYPVVGVVDGNIIQDLSNVSSDADTLAVAALDQLINAKTVAVDGNPVKVILSLKHDFSYPYPDGADVPLDQFPDVTTPDGLAEAEEMVTAIENLLTTNNRGAAIDILVTGNEPMFEIQPNNVEHTATKYKSYLNFLIGRLSSLKSTNNWSFLIFVGALNSPLNLQTAQDNVLIHAVLDVAAANSLVDGIDLHEHVMDPGDVLTDIGYVKEHMNSRITPYSLISTEFSIIKLFEANMNNPVPVGSGEQPLWQFINNTIGLAAAGTPISQSKFLAYFHSQGWYHSGWFQKMIENFEKEGVFAVTYGIEEAPRYPWTDNTVTFDATPWVLNGVFNSSLLGRSGDGFPVTNPLVYQEFRSSIRRSR